MILPAAMAVQLLDAGDVGQLHVDKVHHNNTAQVAQAHLARDLVSRFQIGVGVAQVGIGDRPDFTLHLVKN